MRFILVVLIWLVILGGLRFYFTEHRKVAVVPQASITSAHAGGTYRLALTPTFSVEPDPFALQTDSSKDTGLMVRVNGQPLNLDGRTLHQGKILFWEGVPGVNQGNNEIFVQASPPVTESALSHGIRVQLFTGDTVLIDTTLWSDAGALVAGTVPFAVHITEEARHDH